MVALIHINDACNIKDSRIHFDAVAMLQTSKPSEGDPVG
jgi:hypothetical protein